MSKLEVTAVIKLGLEPDIAEAKVLGCVWKTLPSLPNGNDTASLSKRSRAHLLIKMRFYFIFRFLITLICG